MNVESGPRVSLCMIVRNEEHNLPRCLESVHDLVHEIVIVDTGSHDRTCEIAAQYNARVIKSTWSDDFAAARNLSLDHATGDWILWLDADDLVPANQRASLQKLLGQLDYSAKIYFFGVHSLLAADNAETNILKQARLFRADPRLRWARRIHEQIIPACLQLGYTEHYTDLVIEHTGYRDAALYQRKINRDLRLLRMEFATNPKDAVTLFYLGLNLMKTGKCHEALGYLLQGYQLSRDSTLGLVSSLCSTLVECLAKNGQLDQAFNIGVDSLRRFPDDRQLVVQIAEMLFRRNQNSEAMHLLHTSLARPAAAGHAISTADLNSGRSLRNLLARIYSAEKRYGEAEQIYQGLIAEDPLNADLWGFLGIHYHNQKRLGDIEYVIKQVEKCPLGMAISEFLKAAIVADQGDFTRARQHCEAAISLNPQGNWARILLCQILYQQQDPDGQLENALRDLLRQDPLNSAAQNMLQEVIQFNQMRNNKQWTVNVNM